ncbi:MAG: DUF6931 family protein [Planctomycetota bacterium]|jgi:hypothetical protein
MKKLREIISEGFVGRIGPFSISDPFKIIVPRPLDEICRDFELQEEAKVYLGKESVPERFVERLVRAKLYSDATRFLAYGLPKRHTIWWAALCVRIVPACFSDPISAEALTAAETWIKDPSEQNRQAALASGGRHNFEMPGAPAAWTAMAAGWSSPAPEMENENVPAQPEHLTAHAASGAIILAATADLDQAKKVYREFLDKGVQIAQGKMQIPA